MYRLAINLLSIGQKPSGNRTYILNLLSHLLPLMKERFLVWLLVSGDNNAEMLKPIISDHPVRIVTLPDVSENAFARMVVEQFWLPVWLRRHQIDLLFAARNFAPIFAKTPVVIGVLSKHLNYMDEAHKRSWRRPLVHTLLRAAGERAKAYVAISEYAGRTYVEQYGLPAERLVVAHLGCDHLRSDGQPTLPPVAGRYALFVSTLHPHKNVSHLLDVTARVSKELPDFKLVIVGRDPGDQIRQLQNHADALGIGEFVHFTGGVGEELLHAYYQHATLFLFPSLTEGFGLTPLEAMVYGLPVVASNQTSIPEVVGQAGILLDPNDVEGWATTTVKILQEESYRHDLAKRARARAAQFTWQRAATTVVECFEDVLQGRPVKEV